MLPSYIVITKDNQLHYRALRYYAIQDNSGKTHQVHPGFFPPIGAQLTYDMFLKGKVDCPEKYGEPVRDLMIQRLHEIIQEEKAVSQNMGPVEENDLLISLLLGLNKLPKKEDDLIDSYERSLRMGDLGEW